MEQNMNEFMLCLEKEILNISNSIGKVNLASSLEIISAFFDEDNIWDLKFEEVEKIKRNLHGANKLTNEEEQFLQSFVNMPIELKKLKKKMWGISLEQKKVLEIINSKIKQEKDRFQGLDLDKLEKTLKAYKILFSKLKQNDINLITEIDLVTEIIEKYQISIENRIEIYQAINQINTRIFENYQTQEVILTDQVGEEDVLSEENILSEENLVETNLPDESLKELFEKFNIHWEIEEDELLTEQKKLKKQKKLDENWQKLLKYGNYDEMQLKLQFMKDKELEFIFALPDILTRVLLFTTLEQLESLIKKSTDNGIDYKIILIECPDVLFPSIRENNKTIKIGGNGGNGSVSGAYQYYMRNIDFLNENAYLPQKVFESCPSFSRFKTSTVRKIHQRLVLYGISFKNQDGTLKKGFSALGTLGVLDRLDVGLECGRLCHQYYQDNISKLTDSKLNLYRIKLAISQNEKEEEIFKSYSSQKNGIYLPGKYSGRTSEQYGSTPDDTFKKYGAIVPEFESKAIYDNIIDNNDNDVISDISLKDNLIIQLDDLYKSLDNDLLYNFDGVLISRLKVLRFYQTLISNSSITPSKDVLLYSITKFSMLNEEEYNTIINCIKQIKFKGRVLS